MDYPALKAEIALPEYAGMTDDQIAAALNALISPPVVPLFPIPIASIHGILLMSATGDWVRVTLRSEMALSQTWDTAPTSGDVAIIAARNAVTLASSKVTEIDPQNWAAFLVSVAALVAAGDVSPVSQAAIQGLAVMPVATSRAAQLGFDPTICDMTQEILAARKLT